MTNDQLIGKFSRHKSDVDAVTRWNNVNNMSTWTRFVYNHRSSLILIYSFPWHFIAYLRVYDSIWNTTASFRSRLFRNKSVPLWIRLIKWLHTPRVPTAGTGKYEIRRLDQQINLVTMMPNFRTNVILVRELKKKKHAESIIKIIIRWKPWSFFLLHAFLRNNNKAQNELSEKK